jgi:UDP-N-acetylmuramate dehydrogenase
MIVESNVPLQPYNSFGIVARAQHLARITGEADLVALRADPQWRDAPRFVLGGGSNIVLTGDVKPLVLKVEIKGLRLVEETPRAWIVEAGAGETWHAYGVELQDRFDSLDAVDLTTGQPFSLNAAQCAFGYRDSVFKHVRSGPNDFGLAGRAVITRVRLRLPKPWKAVVGYLDLERKMEETGNFTPSALDIFEWICAIRRAKLPDWRVLGNAGSFFKNPTVTPEQCADIIARDPKIVHYPMDDGSIKLAAGWLIDACGWKGKSVGNAGVYEKQALVLVNRGGAENPVTGGEVMTLAKAIQTSVYERFGIRLEPEPVVV